MKNYHLEIVSSISLIEFLTNMTFNFVDKKKTAKFFEMITKMKN